MEATHDHNETTPTPPFLDLPLRLELARRKAGLYQDEMANRLGVHRRTVANYESGNTDPKLPALQAWATICDVPVDWLAFGIHRCPSCGESGMTCFSLKPQVTELPTTNGDHAQLALIA